MCFKENRNCEYMLNNFNHKILFYNFFIEIKFYVS